MKKAKEEQKYDIQDFEANGTLEQISKSLSRLAFEISTTDINTINENNDDEQPFYSDQFISCTIFPRA